MAGSGDAGNGADTAEELFYERDLLHRLFVMRIGKAEAHGEHVVGCAPEIACTELPIALEQQACAEQEHDRERDFRGEESFAKTGAAAASGMGARRALQGFDELAGMQTE
jgi:hypothetical protein